MNRIGGTKLRAYSAGSLPKDEVNPNTLQLLKGLGYEIDGLRSKSWDEFAAADAPKFDFIFTVCDDAAGEACPVWPGNPMTAHWGIADPAVVTGDPVTVAQAFREAYRLLQRRIEVFAALPFASLDAISLQNKLKEIGRSEGATAKAQSAQ
jgi:protein-tyrosine-phosphatase